MTSTIGKFIKNFFGDKELKENSIVINNPQTVIIQSPQTPQTSQVPYYNDEEIEKVYYNECFWGLFSRALILPKEVNADKVKATLKNGLLTVRLPKLEKTKEKTIRISEE